MPPKFKQKRKLSFNSKALPQVIMDQDNDELFIIKKNASYLHRYLSGRFTLDDETMIFICWVLGDDKYLIAEHIIEFFDEKYRDEIIREFLECGTDHDDYGRLIIKRLMGIKSLHHNRFRKFILGLIQNKRLNIKYDGLSDIEKGISKIKKMFDLSDTEIEVCTFLFFITSVNASEAFFEGHLECNKFPGRKHLKNILGLDQSDFNALFTGFLGKSGMLKIDRYNIELADDLLLLFQSSPHQSFSKKFFSKVAGNVIPLQFHFNNEREIQHTLQLLKKKSTVPTHILLYGPPGTGKTSFAYGLSQKLGVATFEIARGEDNKSINQRSAILACLTMTNSADGSLVIVDEADAVLNTMSSWLTQDKGWLNHLLEEPGVRMIWITNSIDGIEDSVLRRFAFSIQFKPFSRNQRAQLWKNIARRNKCRSLFTNSDIDDLSKKFKVCPGAIDLAVKKARQVNLTTKENFLGSIELCLEAHQTLSNHGEKPARKDRIEKRYSLDGLNISGDMNALISQLEKFDQYLRYKDKHEINNLNLLFYGPPGTGKSELARYIADRLSRETICKRLSDILDPYVGVAEKNIRMAFEEAEREEAILIIDEADSLLHPREAARHSWEINFTNEFLTQMERFKGILICTTNRLKNLDTASIRRFNQKIGFDFLEPEGNIIFYKKLLEPLVKSPFQESTATMLINTSNLTPGDFKIVRDRYAFYPADELCHEMLIRSLAEESSIKNAQQGRRAIGF